MEIRRARPADAPSLYETRLRALGSDDRFEDADAFRQTMLEGDAPPSLYMAHDGDDVLGFSAADPQTGRILGVWVDPEVAGRGLGTALLRHAEWAATQEGVDELRVECSPDAASFFEENRYRRDEGASGEQVVLTKHVPDPTQDGEL